MTSLLQFGKFIARLRNSETAIRPGLYPWESGRKLTSVEGGPAKWDPL
jgi:hypothetical protein